jgi:hypothetical protein
VSIRGVVAWLGEEKGNLERAAPWCDQRRSDLVEAAREQLRQRSEGERGLGLDAATGQNARESRSSLLDALLPQDRLADPRLPGEDKRRRRLLSLGQKRLDRVKLLVAPDDG